MMMVPASWASGFVKNGKEFRKFTLSDIGLHTSTLLTNKW